MLLYVNVSLFHLCCRVVNKYNQKIAYLAIDRHLGCVQVYIEATLLYPSFAAQAFLCTCEGVLS